MLRAGGYDRYASNEGWNDVVRVRDPHPEIQERHRAGARAAVLPPQGCMRPRIPVSLGV